MAASTGVEVANFNLAFLCEENTVSCMNPDLLSQFNSVLGSFHSRVVCASCYALETACVGGGSYSFACIKSLQDGLTTLMQKECVWRHYNLSIGAPQVDAYGRVLQNLPAVLVFKFAAASDTDT